MNWKVIEERRAWREAREGAYLLRTNLEGTTAEELWTKYIQLTEAEAAFRALKSELSIRPLFHQREPCVKAHVLVAFLGYALWGTLKHLLKGKGSDLSPAHALALLATPQSADIVLPTTDGREIRLRRVGSLRTILFLRDEGQQIPVLTNWAPPSRAAKVVHCLRLRWRQENSFKFLSQHYAIDQIVQYAADPETQDRLVPNPQRKALQEQARALRQQIQALQARLDRALDDNDESWADWRTASAIPPG